MKKLTISSTFKRMFGLTVAGLLAGSVAFAAPVGNVYSFGPLPNLTAGGTPTKNVAITTALNGNLILGLSAQQRYFNPAVTDNGAGMFFAGTGQNNGLGSSAYQGALWNFDFYIENKTSNLFTYEITYGLVGGTVYTFDPAADADASHAGTLQDSQNLMFSNFGGAPNAFAGTFDPNADANYQFSLTAKSRGSLLGETHITVRVGNGSPVPSVPDAGSTSMMLGVALAGIAGLRRKFAA